MKLKGILVLAVTAPVAAFISEYDYNYLDVLSFDESVLYLGDDTTANDVKPLSKWSWSDCGDVEDALKLSKLDVSPDPPQSGRNLTIDAAGVVNRYIAEGAYADVAVKLGYITLYSTRYDLCKEAHNADAQIQCPVEKGERAIKQNIQLPSHIPPAAYTLQVRANTVDDTPLAWLLASVAHSQTVSTSTPVQTKVKEIKDCGTSSAITFQDATGDNIQNITMNVSEQVDSATLTYAIVEQGFKLLSFDGDFCTYLSKSGISCPVSQGSYELDVTNDSDIINSSQSNYTINMDIHNGDTELGCADISFEVPQSPESVTNLNN
ncbi:hypothetical protein E3P94_03323 [Wallemia ichthyophaga]|uniref:Phosphatidylglycerol/phosphatidylinositol transfer protein n=1 Tax=Wallemia ichthyophaga TaxID=245174 RepID=A0A4T0G721_WALIC|nr:hypothetical protein E3P95_03264 [Wallemia ichthyophaga]TIA97429.1 hypothetical protein E3P94_03323 [Wallemia ichthyophaga]TIB38734.1 hypothetical protein E3P86_01460 [Wallemia ichthyophaga]